MSPTARLFRPLVVVTLAVGAAACPDEAPSAPAPLSVAPPPATPAPQAPTPPPPPVAVPQASLKEPEPPRDEDAESKAVIGELRETLARGLTNERNRQRLTRILEAARRDDRPMVLRVLAEAEARASAGAADAIEWRTVMGRLQETADDDAEPSVVEVADRIENASEKVRRASAAERDAMWQRKADERARVDTYGGEAFGMEGTKLRFNKPGQGEVTRRVYGDKDGEVRLEKGDP